MAKSIDYGKLMHRAMRGLIQSVLADVAQDGLPGDHHFFITFDTDTDGVDMAPWLQERYPEEMTLVLQHWFADLKVTEDGFSVTLNFGNNPENITVPFDAVRTFVDPSVEFGLRFESHVGEDDIEEVPEDDPPPPKGEAQILRLDRFRK